MMRDSPFIKRVPRSRDRELLAPNNPLSPQLDDFAARQVTKETASRYHAMPAPSDACVVLNANLEFYFIFNEITSKFRTDEFSIDEVAINFFHPE